MHEKLGMFWPDVPAADGMHQAYINSAEDMGVALAHVKKFDVAIQAGGHCGVWARWLAKRFKAIYTFEPDYQNFQCLVRNIGSCNNIYSAHGFLGSERGPIGLYREQYSLGGSHHGITATGPIPVYRVDDFNLPACDALILDVEGMEYPALKGAIETIRKFSPVIQIENFADYAKFGWGALSDIKSMLGGYAEVGRINYDIVLVKK